jgi:hypothetical protein
MKKRNLLIATILILAGNLATGTFAQENIRAMIKKYENTGVVETDVVRKNYPVIKKFNRSTTIIKLESTPDLAQQFEDAFRQDSEKAIHAIEQKKDGKTYLFYRYESSTYSYTKSNNVINIIESIETRHRFGLYTFFINVVPDDFRFPLLGFINTTIGSHQGLQTGFINTTLSDFNGAQFGFINSTFNDNTGLQAGFVNTTINEINGLQMGYINSAGFAMQNGSQIGFVNLIRKEIKGAQIGFVNIAGGNVLGSQLGFVNLAGRNVTGSQIGFVNYADTVSGVPIGFLSIVKKGGYKAIEVSVNEWYPVNVSFKTGVPKFYTFIQGSYNDHFEKRFAVGYGFGSLLPFSKKVFFNPELSSMHPISEDYHSQIQSFAANIRFKISPNLQIAAGPSISHVYFDNEMYYEKPEYSFLNHSINAKNRLVIAARAALTVNF